MRNYIFRIFTYLIRYKEKIDSQSAIYIMDSEPLKIELCLF